MDLIVPTTRILLTHEKIATLCQVVVFKCEYVSTNSFFCIFFDYFAGRASWFFHYGFRFLLYLLFFSFCLLVVVGGLQKLTRSAWSLH